MKSKVKDLAFETETLKCKVKNLALDAQPSQKEQITEVPPAKIAIPPIPKPTDKQDNEIEIPDELLTTQTEKKQAPSNINIILNKIKTYFTTGNVITKAGVLILFFGVTFLGKYAADRGVLPIELRLLGLGVFGCALVKIGLNLKEKNRGYSLSLQGGGLGIVFITCFIAYKVYEILPPVITMTALVLTSVVYALLAISQNAMSLAMLGVVGGFLAPILASSGSGNYILLFSYYLVLNLGITFIAHYKTWRPLNLIGFLGTFVISALWTGGNYTSEKYIYVQPFIIIFYALYLIIPIMFAAKTIHQKLGRVDTTLVFGTAVIGFAIQAKLVHHFQYGSAISAIILSLTYFFIASWLHKKREDHFGLLIDSFIYSCFF